MTKSSVLSVLPSQTCLVFFFLFRSYYFLVFFKNLALFQTSECIRIIKPCSIFITPCSLFSRCYDPPYTILIQTILRRYTCELLSPHIPLCAAVFSIAEAQADHYARVIKDGTLERAFEWSFKPLSGTRF